MLNPPKYLSRLMQTLEPAFEQLIRIQVLGSYQIISSEEWRIALHRHPSYVSERKTLLDARAAGRSGEPAGAVPASDCRQAGSPPKWPRRIARQPAPRWSFTAWNVRSGCCRP